MKALRRRTALGALVLTATAATFAAGAPAYAAAPGNDVYAGAIPVSLGYTASADTTEAGTDADDAALVDAGCSPPATDASVWYSLTQATDGGVLVDVSNSDYTAGVVIASGGPGNWTLENCGPDVVSFYATAGTTYSILAFDYQEDGGGNGGTLDIRIADVPPPPVVDITVDKVASFNSRTGVATVTGQVTCSGDAEFGGMEVGLTQQVGRVSTVRGWGYADIDCDGTAHAWSAQVSPDNGKFAGGKAASVTFAYACGSFQCSEDFEERTVQLRGKK